MWDQFPTDKDDDDEWRIQTSMISFDVIEYHHRERVMRLCVRSA